MSIKDSKVDRILLMERIKRIDPCRDVDFRTQGTIRLIRSNPKHPSNPSFLMPAEAT